MHIVTHGGQAHRDEGHRVRHRDGDPRPAEHLPARATRRRRSWRTRTCWCWMSVVGTSPRRATSTTTSGVAARSPSARTRSTRSTSAWPMSSPCGSGTRSESRWTSSAPSPRPRRSGWRSSRSSWCPAPSGAVHVRLRGGGGNLTIKSTQPVPPHDGHRDGPVGEGVRPEDRRAGGDVLHVPGQGTEGAGVPDGRHRGEPGRPGPEVPRGRRVPRAGRPGKGWSLYRFNDHPAVDFSVLEGDPAILFAHKGGFIAKTSARLHIDEVLSLVERAIS